MKMPTQPRQSQAQRRANSYRQLLDAACQLFGERGFHQTSLEDIAALAQLTTRPIYHYFGNKLGLFEAVNEVMVDRLMQRIDEAEGVTSLQHNWRSFLMLCDDVGFRRILLLDSPAVLGRERWLQSAATHHAHRLLTNSVDQARQPDKNRFQLELLSRMLITALSEVALMIGEAKDVDLAKQQADKLVSGLLRQLPELLKLCSSTSDSAQ